MLALQEAYDGTAEAIQTSNFSAYYVFTPIAVTNGTDGTYYYYYEMNGYKQLGIQLIIGAGSGSVTATVEGTMQDDGTAQASCTYKDVTNALYGAASFTASNVLFDTNTKCGNFKYLRVKIVANTGGAGDGDWTIFAKKLF